MKIGKYEFDTSHQTYIMGILNVTPDSFSDGGKYNQTEVALEHVAEMLAQGCDIIDVGGESTRPGYEKISDEEEILRVVPVIRAIKERYDVAVSVDTYKSKVALAAIEAGADLINDIWGFKYDPEMAKVVADHKVACCLMHNREDADYVVFVEDVIADLRESIELALAAGVNPDAIMIDPGVGFAKSYEQNLLILNHLEELQVLGYPILLGTSKKSVIGNTLGVPTEERVIGTCVTTAIGLQKGCAFFRVHNVKENKETILMTKAILNAK